eukprot:TRINITY_DN4616_c0_g2_i1.p1 TRINITY_DN4616_c0_g2~~TRINITY_DN4616_c0_g2_i1.p1  ORF type:complete len:1073 (-),score=141.62 TRINITY_DN4616_c0_g2_i1:33-3251(-)
MRGGRGGGGNPPTTTSASERTSPSTTRNTPPPVAPRRGGGVSGAARGGASLPLAKGAENATESQFAGRGTALPSLGGRGGTVGRSTQFPVIRPALHSSGTAGPRPLQQAPTQAQTSATTITSSSDPISATSPNGDGEVVDPATSGNAPAGRGKIQVMPIALTPMRLRKADRRMTLAGPQEQSVLDSLSEEEAQKIEAEWALQQQTQPQGEQVRSGLTTTGPRPVTIIAGQGEGRGMVRSRAEEQGANRATLQPSTFRMIVPPVAPPRRNTPSQLAAALAAGGKSNNSAIAALVTEDQQHDVIVTKQIETLPHIRIAPSGERRADILVGRNRRPLPYSFEPTLVPDSAAEVKHDQEDVEPGTTSVFTKAKTPDSPPSTSSTRRASVDVTCSVASPAAKQFGSAAAAANVPAPEEVSIPGSPELPAHQSAVDAQLTLRKTRNPGVRGNVLYDYSTKRDYELTIRRGDFLVVHERDASGWWTGEINGKYGLFPGAYVQLLGDTSPPLIARAPMEISNQKEPAESRLVSTPTPIVVPFDKPVVLDSRSDKLPSDSPVPGSLIVPRVTTSTTPVKNKGRHGKKARKEKRKKDKEGPIVSQPTVMLRGGRAPTLNYRTAVVVFAYQNKEIDEMPLVVGDVIAVFETNESGWWLGRSTSQGKQGLFPADFVRWTDISINKNATAGFGSSELLAASKLMPTQAAASASILSSLSASIEELSKEQPEMISPRRTHKVQAFHQRRAIATTNYEAQGADELSLVEGEYIVIVGFAAGREGDWYSAVSESESWRYGLVPGSHIQFMGTEKELLVKETSKQELHNGLDRPINNRPAVDKRLSIMETEFSISLALREESDDDEEACWTGSTRSPRFEPDKQRDSPKLSPRPNQDPTSVAIHTDHGTREPEVQPLVPVLPEPEDDGFSVHLSIDEDDEDDNDGGLYGSQTTWPDSLVNMYVPWPGEDEPDANSAIVTPDVVVEGFAVPRPPKKLNKVERASVLMHYLVLHSDDDDDDDEDNDEGATSREQQALGKERSGLSLPQQGWQQSKASRAQVRMSVGAARGPSTIPEQHNNNKPNHNSVGTL